MKFYLVRNALSLKHQFSVGMILSDLTNAIRTIKKHFPKSGIIMEYAYIGRGNPDINDFTLGKQSDAENLQTIECLVNSIFINSLESRKALTKESKQIAEFFHVSDSILEYYYFVAAFLYVFDAHYLDLDTSIFDNDQMIALNRAVYNFQKSLEGVVEIEK